MYYPYLRGKQEELLALGELLEKGILSEKIIPIIEPVSLSPTLVNILELFSEQKRDIFIVQNPNVGQFYDDLESAGNTDELDDDKEIKKAQRMLGYKERYIKVLDSEYINCAICIGEDFEDTDINKENKKYAVIYHDEGSVINFNEEMGSNVSVCLVPSTDFRKQFSNELVLFGDRFNKRDSNSDYVNHPKDFFSRDHLIYTEYQYQGFSDYSIIGKKFDTGFAPYTIAIHIVYLEKDTNIMSILHFTSDSNTTNKNQAGKFSEAAKKLKTWIEQNNRFSTMGIREIVKCYETQDYPGLGKLKRFTIMHHLELVGNFLEVE